MPQRIIYSTPNAPLPIGPYNQAVQLDNVVFTHHLHHYFNSKLRQPSTTKRFSWKMYLSMTILTILTVTWVHKIETALYYCIMLHANWSSFIENVFYLYFIFIHIVFHKRSGRLCLWPNWSEPIRWPAWSGGGWSSQVWLIVNITIFKSRFPLIWNICVFFCKN